MISIKRSILRRVKAISKYSSIVIKKKILKKLRKKYRHEIKLSKSRN